MTRYGFGSRTKGAADGTSRPVPCRYVSFAGHYGRAERRERRRVVRHRGVRRIIFPIFQPPRAMTISLVKPAWSAMVAP